MGATAVATAAIIIILSVFNGFRDLAESKYSRFDPPLKLVSSIGGSFMGDSIFKILSLTPEIKGFAPVVSLKAFATSADGQMALNLKGVDQNFLNNSGVESIVIDGVPFVGDTLGAIWGIPSVGVALSLSVRPGDGRHVQLMVPKRKGRINPASLFGSFQIDSIISAGVFQSEEPTLDTDLLLAPIDLVRNLGGFDSTEITEINIYPTDNADINSIKKRLSSAEYDVLTIEEQNRESFNMIAIEKWISFALLAFILFIASFNIISTLTILIIEKKNNMLLIRSLGGSKRLIKTIYLWEGILISFFGGVTGTVIGLILSLCQEHFGWIKFYGDINPSMLSVNAYPVAVHLTDIAPVMGLIVFLSLITTFVALSTYSNKDEKLIQ